MSRALRSAYRVTTRARRAQYYAKLSKPLAALEFMEPLREEMTAELEAVQQACRRWIG